MKESNPYKAVRFLKELYSGCKGDGYVDIRIVQEGKDIFVPIAKIGSEIPKIKKRYRGESIYFGVATRQDGNGSKAGIIEIPSLWCDIDFNGRPRQDVWNELKKFRPKPTAVIKTGGGYHLYWFLKNPARRDQIPEVESILKRLASHLGGDLKAAEVARILRIPGSVNLKPGRNGYRARLISLHFNRRYALEDFDLLPPLKEDQEVDNNFPSWSDRLILEGVSEGKRNDAITKLAGRYAGKGLSRVEILPILLRANTKFAPPLSKKEVTKTLASVLKTHQRNNLDDNNQAYTSERGEGRGLTKILSEPTSEPDYLIKPFLQAGDKGFLVASYKVGKTLFAMMLTLCVSSATPFLGFTVPKPRKVLFIRFELSWRRFTQSLRMMKQGLESQGQCHVEPVFELVRGFNILGQKDFDWLNRMIDKHEPALLILDPLYKMTNLDLRDTSSAMPLIRRFESIRERYTKLCILINSHQIKNAQSEKSWDTSYGPMQFFADMDFEIRLRVSKRESKDPKFTLDHISNDQGIVPMQLRRDPNTLLYYPDHTSEQKKQGQEEKEFEEARRLLTAFIKEKGRNPSQTEFRGAIENELHSGKKRGGKTGDSKARKIIKDGLDKYWKELPEGKGRSIRYEPITDPSTLE